jgi:hypothetical protein
MHDTPDPLKSMAGKIGAHTKYSRLDKAGRYSATLAARTALEDKWLAEADGDPVRAKHLKAVHYQRMAMKSVMARRRRATPLRVVPGDADKPEAEAGGPDARAS